MKTLFSTLIATLLLFSVVDACEKDDCPHEHLSNSL